MNNLVPMPNHLYQPDCTSFTPVELVNQYGLFSNRDCTPRHKDAFYAILSETKLPKPEESQFQPKPTRTLDQKFKPTMMP